MQEEKIGEKGIGFKSVFHIAENVEIHSRCFDFSISQSAPTVPNVLPPDNFNGTRMIFSCRKNSNLKTDYPVEELIRLCLCLRRLDFQDIQSFHLLLILFGLCSIIN